MRDIRVTLRREGRFLVAGPENGDYMRVYSALLKAFESAYLDLDKRQTWIPVEMSGTIAEALKVDGRIVTELIPLEQQPEIQPHQREGGDPWALSDRERNEGRRLFRRSKQRAVYTKPQKAWILENYPYTRNKELSEITGRSYKALTDIAKRGGVRKDPALRKQMLKECHEEMREKLREKGEPSTERGGEASALTDIRDTLLELAKRLAKVQ